MTSSLNRSITLIDVTYFLLLFMLTGLQSVILQLFFLNNYPADKNIFLSLAIIVGTCASIAGMHCAHGLDMSLNLRANISSRSLLSTLILLTVATFVALFFIQNLYGYFLIFALHRFLWGVIYNYLDHYCVSITPPSQRPVHIQSLIIYSFLGVATAPFYFSFAAGRVLLHTTLICAIGCLCMLLTMLHVAAGRTANLSVPDRANVKELSFTLRDWLFYLYAAIIFLIVNMVTYVFIYVVRDYYQIADATIKGGIFIGTSSVVTILTVLAYAALQKRPSTVQYQANRPLRLGLGLNMAVILIFLVACFLLFAKLSDSNLYFMLIAAITGVASGLFFANTRAFASQLAILHQRPQFLSLYNNLNNYGTIVGFLAVLAVSVLAKYLVWNCWIVIFYLIVVLFVVGGGLLLLLRRSYGP